MELEVPGFVLYWCERGKRNLWYDPKTDRLYDREALDKLLACPKDDGKTCQRDGCPRCHGMPF